MTPLDSAHAAMQAAENTASGDAARLQFYEQLADTELFVLLTQEASGDSISPELFEVENGRFVLAFDQQERLAGFSGHVAPYAAMSGRVLAQMLDGQGIGLGVNLDVAPSSILVPAEAVSWLNTTLEQAPDRVEARIRTITAPTGLPEVLIPALEAKLQSAVGLAQGAWLVGVQYVDGGRGHMLAFVGAAPRVEEALAKAAGEALTFSGVEAGQMDVGFFAAQDPVVAQMAPMGVYFDLPRPEAGAPPSRPAPGSDPEKPPILR